MAANSINFPSDKTHKNRTESTQISFKKASNLLGAGCLTVEAEDFGRQEVLVGPILALEAGAEGALCPLGAEHPDLRDCCLSQS